MKSETNKAMSLEQAIKENTEAVLKLTALFARYVPAETASAPATPAAPAEEPKAVPAATPAAPAEEPKAVKKATEPAPAAPAKPAAPAAPAVSLADLQAEGKKLLDAGRQAELKALVTKLGSAKLSLLPAEKYAEALVELKKLNADDSM